jgi:hypothetical protein
MSLNHHYTSRLDRYIPDFQESDPDSDHDFGDVLAELESEFAEYLPRGSHE